MSSIDGVAVALLVEPADLEEGAAPHRPEPGPEGLRRARRLLVDLVMEQVAKAGHRPGRLGRVVVGAEHGVEPRVLEGVAQARERVAVDDDVGVDERDDVAPRRARRRRFAPRRGPRRRARRRRRSRRARGRRRGSPPGSARASAAGRWRGRLRRASLLVPRLRLDRHREELGRDRLGGRLVVEVEGHRVGVRREVERGS